MEITDVLRHAGAPRTEYFVDIPGAMGTLRLDVFAPVEVAFSSVEMDEHDLETCKGAVAEAVVMLDGGDPEGGANRLLNLVTQYPYYAPAYGALANLYWKTGNTGEAEYNFKQLIALDRGFPNIMRFAKFLGSGGRLAEARLLGTYLWEHRAGFPEKMALEAVHDYLVTLSRIPEPDTMIAICGQAMAEYGGETTLVYQWIYAYILDGQAGRAVELLEEVLPKLGATDPLRPRFEEMQHVALEMRGR